MFDNWSELQAAFAHKLGENAAPATTTSEYTRRNQALNDARAEILNEANWWFLEKTGTDTTVANQQAYTMPSDAKTVTEVRVNSSLPFKKVHSKEATLYTNGIVTAQYPQAYGMALRNRYAQRNGQILLIPTPANSGDTIYYTYIQTYDDLTPESAESLYLIPEPYRGAWAEMAIGFWYMQRRKRDVAKEYMSEANRQLNGMRLLQDEYNKVPHNYTCEEDPEYIDG